VRIVVTISIMIACGVGGVLLWSHGLLHAAGRAAPSATSLIDGRLPIRLEVVTPPGQQIEGLREVVAQWLEMNRCRVVPLDAPFPVSAPPKLVVRIVRDPAENVAFFYVSLELWNFVPIDSKFTEAMT
jgi:hypothetical protein